MEFYHLKAHRAAQMMRVRGGDFVGLLADAFFKADLTNAKKMYDAYTDYFDQYYGMWLEMHEGNYKKSDEFTEDLATVPATLDSAYQLLTSAKFRNWMKQAELQYGEEATRGLMLRYHALKSNTEVLANQAKSFQDSMLELDEPK